MAVEPQVQQFIDFIRDEMPRRIKTNPNDLPNAEKLLVSVSGTLEVIYKTLAELDIAIKSDVDTELSNKEPSITAGSDTQYWRGDKTFQTLDAAAVAETEGRVYLSPEQKTVATQAASSSQSGYLTSADWSTFNGKQNALADVITSDTYGSSTQYPVITFNTKGIATGVTLQTPTFTDATFSVQKNGSPSIAATWDLSALTGSVVHTYPNKAIDFKTLSSVGASNSNSLSGTAVRCRILGGSSNTVSGTDNIVIGGSGNVATGLMDILINCTAAVASGNDVVALNARGPNASNLEANCILLGTSKQTDGFKNIGTAAALRLNALYALSSDIPISGTLYATIDGSQTLSASNLVLGVNDTGACATHEVEFMVCVGTASGFGGVLPTGYFIAKRRIAVFRQVPSGTFYVSAVQTIGTDVTLGTLDGTITPDLSIDTTIGSATIHRLRCKIDRTGGVAGQEVVAMSVRVESHHSR
ncbi:MAG TPA: hypothetical protein PLN40_09475 [Agitococcus sp.]|nr:hypothetical protein [Agitococcus sp.]